MIRSPLGLRLNPSRPMKEQVLEASHLGAKGVVVDAAGELAPERLSETGRREVRHFLRSVAVDLIALHLPTRRPFDTADQLDERLARADRAFAMAFDLGTPLVLARVGGLPAVEETQRRELLTLALRDLGQRADHRGVRLALETGTEPGADLRAFLDALAVPALAASIDPGALLQNRHDPSATTRALGPWVAHAYASSPDTSTPSARVSLPRQSGFPPGAVDWEEYLGALEEINYRGYLTVQVSPHADPGPQFKALADLFSRF
ncbi:MAG TPA: TIM barrel protein [Isosphaeraceae bacterium]|jgi:sugar phosphate isomerase/epimerase|nr:TIM barrel protein [Isosphaeraceae bacterium]